MSYIKAEKLTKSYGTGSAEVNALCDAVFEIESGTFVSIMGESGSGKSTLLSIMGAMNSPSTGKYYVDGIDIYNLKPDKKSDFRREFLGFVFQSFHLMPYLTVLENVMLPLTTTLYTKKEKLSMARHTLTRVGLEDKFDRLPNQISGGEKERVSVARAIVNNPPILLADEPTGNLDSVTTMEIMDLLQSLNEDGMTIAMVTHSLDCAEYADRMMKLSDGYLSEIEMDYKQKKEA